ncbi:hypothetical protein PINS_up009463 [Pythium insidiosum]|nr:hypothetical protein PINS_up009463 [Pythium insidiosum]
MIRQEDVQVALLLAPWSFRLFWCLIVGVHLVFVVYLCMVAALYLELPKRAPRVVVNAELFQVGVEQRYFGLVAAGYFVVALLHVKALAVIIIYCFLTKRLLLLPPSSSRWRKFSLWGKLKSIVLTAYRRFRIKPATITKPVRGETLRRMSNAASHSVQSVAASLEVTDSNFDVMHITRELIETGLLSFQAYRSSYLIAMPWINSLLAVLLVLNCWITPLIHRMSPKRRAVSRSLNILVDIALDSVTVVVVPIVLFLPYYKRLDVLGNYSSNDFWYTDLSFMRVITEWQMLFVTSLSDGVSKFLIATSTIRSLTELPKLIKPILHSTALQVGTSDSTTPVVDSNTFKVVVSERSSRAEALGRYILLLWGALVLIVHLHAASRPSNHLCRLQVRPWFAKYPACSLMEIDCERNVQRGDAQEFDAAIASSEPNWLSYLIIRHCPHVTITPRIRDLRNLIGLKIFNSTLHEWDLDAALTSAHHSHMLFLFMARVNMTSFPPALSHTNMPSSLADIELCQLNITSLPESIGTTWPKRLLLVVEGINFVEFPRVILELQPSMLSLSMNNFTSVPTELLSIPSLTWLKLNGNPISAIPTPSHTTSPIKHLFVEATNVSDIPSWFFDPEGFLARAGRTPLCDMLLAAPTKVDQEGDAHLELLRRRVNCTAPDDRDHLFHFQVTMESVRNP